MKIRTEKQIQKLLKKFFKDEKVWIIRKYIDDDIKNVVLNRINYGFDSYELLGIAEFSRQEIIDQIQNKINPNVIKREVYE